MVIQSYMKVADIVNTWDKTKQVFTQYGIPLNNDESLKEILSDFDLEKLLSDLNHAIGSSEETCIPGG
jgi:hypothetical protein